MGSAMERKHSLDHDGISLEEYQSPPDRAHEQPLLDSPLSARFHTFGNAAKKSPSWRAVLLVLLLVIVVFSIFVAILKNWYHFQTSTSLALADKENVMEASRFPEQLRTAKTICSYCDCQANRTSPPLLRDPSYATPTGTRASMLAYVWLSIRDIYCQHAWLGEGPALDLLQQTELGADIPQLIQWNMEGLEAGVPTAYLYTKTSWAGRTKHLRYAYFKRHILTIRTHIALMKKRAWPEGEGHPPWGQKRQLVWIVVEDGEALANDVAQELSSSGLPYIYFTYGPTHHFGNAQQNAAYALIHRLSDPGVGGILGNGPVLSIDDDSNFLPELLVIIWDVQRIGVWPMGNLGPHGWEGPVYDPDSHALLRWEAGAIQDRKFPVDNGAFTFASELLGATIKGPRYWPTDISGGENEFISLIVANKEDLEPLCYNCHLAWHNEPLPPACTDLQICP